MTDRTGICAVCGESFPLTKSWRKYCSAKCGRKGAPSSQMVTASCVICGASVQRIKRHADGRDTICSETCSSELKRRRQSAPRSELPADHPARWILGQQSSPLRYYECADCGRQACYDARYPSARRCKRCRSDPHKYARFIVGFCSQCGQSFVRDRLQCSNLQKGGDTYCSHRCSKKAHKARRKARKRQGFVEHVSRHYIFERDGYCCQICGKKLAMSKVAPHPKAPTLDHIVPIARGGTHERSNLQAAHFICNALKSDGAAADQLLLLG